ncbi:MAG: hypothetical protein K2K16_05900 [Ruminococcus sp.]|nr:hypothetical protein [Ruminococcus sp.]
MGFYEKFVRDWDINIQTICDMVISQIFDREHCEVFSPEDDARLTSLQERLTSLQERITNATALDEDFKRKFDNDMQCYFCIAAQNAFENGLNVGLRLLQTLINAKLPENITVNEPDITRQCKPMKRDTGYNRTFIDFIEKVSPYLSRTQKIRLEGRIKCLLSENMERDIGISCKTNGGIL